LILVVKPKAPRVNDIPTKRKALEKWIDKRFPEGIPAGMKREQIVADFKTDTGTVVSTKTVGRALGRK
jgi:hypothetical protein